MESGPAIFVGVMFALFGGGLLLWTMTRLRQGESVAQGVRPALSASLASATAVTALVLGAWRLTPV